jgi:hypothetical protein
VLSLMRFATRTRDHGGELRPWPLLEALVVSGEGLTRLRRRLGRSRGSYGPGSTDVTASSAALQRKGGQPFATVWTSPRCVVRSGTFSLRPISSSPARTEPQWEFVDLTPPRPRHRPGGRRRPRRVCIPATAGFPTTTVLSPGSLGHEPNRDAASWIHAEISPRVGPLVSDAKFRLVGSLHPKDIQVLDDPDSGFHVVGQAHDILAELRQADVFLMPLSRGGGTRLESLSASSVGVPIVSFSVSTNGLDSRATREAWLRNDPEGLRAPSQACSVTRDQAPARRSGPGVRRGPAPLEVCHDRFLSGRQIDARMSSHWRIQAPSMDRA